MGGKNNWDSKKYLNIWIGDLGLVSGYGTAPGTPAAKDGVVINYKYFGTVETALAPFNKGRTATHEIGHWLGLLHLWSAAGNCIDGDDITDTPVQSGPVYGCNLTAASCTQLSMVQNYMGYADDACMNLFSVGQKQVMRETLLKLRPQNINYTGSIILGASDLTNELASAAYLYPNPNTSGTVKIKFSENDSARYWCLQVYNSVGVLIIIKQKYQSDEEVLLPGTTKPGLYLVKLKNVKFNYTFKLVYNR